MDDSGWAARFPALWKLDFQPYANADLTFRLGAPDDDLVTRLHLVAQVPDGRVGSAGRTGSGGSCPGAGARRRTSP
jgi:hypothetical protein